MSEWKCPTCTYFNKASRPGCEMCATEKPDHRKLITLSIDKLICPKLEELHITETTWECDQCTFINDRTRPGCAMCANERPLEALPDVGAQKIFYVDCQDLVILDKKITCDICMEDIEPGYGMRLRGCLHELCRTCCFEHIVKCDNPAISCPICKELICDRDIRGLLNDVERRKYYDRMSERAALTLPHIFTCLTPDCPGKVDVENRKPEDRFFMCSGCKNINCLNCETQHEDKETCTDYNKSGKRELKAKLLALNENYIKKFIDEGKLMKCPNCKIVLEKTDQSCDWIKCIRCSLEICWCTKGPRWGPKGKDDISGGCRCRVNGKKCHPDCTTCH